MNMIRSAKNQIAELTAAAYRAALGAAFVRTQTKSRQV